MILRSDDRAILYTIFFISKNKIPTIVFLLKFAFFYCNRQMLHYLLSMPLFFTISLLYNVLQTKRIIPPQQVNIAYVVAVKSPFDMPALLLHEFIHSPLPFIAFELFP